MLTLSKRIAVAIDGSPQSDKAAEEAVRLASIHGLRGKSKIFAILALPNMKAPTYTDFFPTPPPTEQPEWEEKKRRHFYVIDKAATESQTEWEPVVLYGDPVDAILDFSDREDIDLIVIGSSGAGKVKRALGKSVSAKIAMQAKRSVYIVR